MNAALKRPLALLIPLLLLLPQCVAFEIPLTEQTIREAYFIGQHHDASTESALVPYIRHLAPPKKGPYISEVRLFTPYAQVIDSSNSQSGGYSAQQAAADYHSRSDTILVRVRVEFTATYGFLEAGRNAKDIASEKGIKIRQDDFWQAFRVGLSQKDQWIDPLSQDGEATYSDIGMNGALLWLVCDAHDIESNDATVEVFTPDGQHVTTTFDLASLR